MFGGGWGEPIIHQTKLVLGVQLKSLNVFEFRNHNTTQVLVNHYQQLHSIVFHCVSFYLIELHNIARQFI